MKRFKLFCIALIISLILCACGSVDSSEDTGSIESTGTTGESLAVTEDSSTENTEVTTIPQTEVTTEPTVFQGYTVEDLEGVEGIYYILENGNLDRYYAGGFKMWAGIYDGGRDTLFMPAWRVDSNPVLTQNDTIAIFSNQNINVSLEPIIAAGMTASLSAEGENVVLNPIYGSNGKYYHAISLADRDEVYVELINSEEDALFGVEMDVVSYTYYYKSYGKIYSKELTFDSFPKDQEVTISCVEGTKVVQTTKYADYYYFVYGSYYTTYDDTLPQPQYEVTPTVSGYAAVSMENVPAGQYVMIVTTEDNSYYGTVITVE